MSKINWTAYAFDIAVVGLEFGFLCVYRAGWKISTANLFSSITLARVLSAVGLLLYRETVTLRQLTGMGICIIGLLFLAK